MRYYIALVHKDESSAYGIQFPDVPGCFSAADELDHLVPNAIESLNLYAEDSPLPAPRSIDQLRADKEIASELAAGAFLISVSL